MTNKTALGPEPMLALLDIGINLADEVLSFLQSERAAIARDTLPSHKRTTITHTGRRHDIMIGSLQRFASAVLEIAPLATVEPVSAPPTRTSSTSMPGPDQPRCPSRTKSPSTSLRHILTALNIVPPKYLKLSRVKAVIAADDRLKGLTIKPVGKNKLSAERSNPKWTLDWSQSTDHKLKASLARFDWTSVTRRTRKKQQQGIEVKK